MKEIWWYYESKIPHIWCSSRMRSITSSQQLAHLFDSLKSQIDRMYTDFLLMLLTIVKNRYSSQWMLPNETKGGIQLKFGLENKSFIIYNCQYIIIVFPEQISRIIFFNSNTLLLHPSRYFESLIKWSFIWINFPGSCGLFEGRVV